MKWWVRFHLCPHWNRERFWILWVKLTGLAHSLSLDSSRS